MPLSRLLDCTYSQMLACVPPSSDCPGCTYDSVSWRPPSAKHRSVPPPPQGINEMVDPMLNVFKDVEAGLVGLAEHSLGAAGGLIDILPWTSYWRSLADDNQKAIMVVVLVPTILYLIFFKL